MRRSSPPRSRTIVDTPRESCFQRIKISSLRHAGNFATVLKESITTCKSQVTITAVIIWGSGDVSEWLGCRGYRHASHFKRTRATWRRRDLGNERIYTWPWEDRAKNNYRSLTWSLYKSFHSNLFFLAQTLQSCRMRLRFSLHIEILYHRFASRFAWYRHETLDMIPIWPELNKWYGVQKFGLSKGSWDGTES